MTKYGIGGTSGGNAKFSSFSDGREGGRGGFIKLSMGSSRPGEGSGGSSGGRSY